MIEFLSAFLAVIVAFIAGMLCEARRQKHDKRIIQELQFIGEPPPWHLEKPTVVTHLYAPWKR